MVSALTKRWKSPCIIHWDDFRNRIQPTDSAEEASKVKSTLPQQPQATTLTAEEKKQQAEIAEAIVRDLVASEERKSEQRTPEPRR